MVVSPRLLTGDLYASTEMVVTGTNSSLGPVSLIYTLCCSRSYAVTEPCDLGNIIRIGRLPLTRKMRSLALCSQHSGFKYGIVPDDLFLATQLVSQLIVSSLTLEAWCRLLETTLYWKL